MELSRFWRSPVTPEEGIMTDARTLKQLEKLFAAEINGQDAQLHPRTADKLEKLGFIVRDVRSERAGPFTMQVEFHRLTHLGRYTYCETCTED
jgi:hypothetical protein